VNDEKKIKRNYFSEKIIPSKKTFRRRVRNPPPLGYAYTLLYSWYASIKGLSLCMLIFQATKIPIHYITESFQHTKALRSAKSVLHCIIKFPQKHITTKKMHFDHPLHKDANPTVSWIKAKRDKKKVVQIDERKR